MESEDANTLNNTRTKKQKPTAHVPSNVWEQINPDLRVCPKETVFNRNVMSKGVQVPDRRLPSVRNRRSPPRRDRNENTGRGYRVFNQRFPRRTNTRRASSLAESSSLRADAPPHVPESVQRRAKSGRSMSSVSNRRREKDFEEVFSSEEENKTSTKKIETNLKKENGTRNDEGKKLDTDGDYKMESIGKNQDTTDKEEKEDPLHEQSDKPESQNSMEKDANENETAAVSHEEDAITKLERRWGYFFCRCCLHAWVSGNVWCVKGSEKVYIMQTCNFCNEVVKPQVGGKFREQLFSEKWTPSQDMKNLSDVETFFSF